MHFFPFNELFEYFNFYSNNIPKKFCIWKIIARLYKYLTAFAHFATKILKENLFWIIILKTQ